MPWEIGHKMAQRRTSSTVRGRPGVKHQRTRAALPLDVHSPLLADIRNEGKSSQDLENFWHVFIHMVRSFIHSCMHGAPTSIEPMMLH